MEPDLYPIVRSTKAGPDGRACYELVDRAGRLYHVTLPRNLSATDDVREVLRAVVAARGAPRPVGR